jgi:hypothetical protein
MRKYVFPVKLNESRRIANTKWGQLFHACFLQLDLLRRDWWGSLEMRLSDMQSVDRVAHEIGTSSTLK